MKQAVLKGDRALVAAAIAEGKVAGLEQTELTEAEDALLISEALQRKAQAIDTVNLSTLQSITGNLTGNLSDVLDFRLSLKILDLIS